MRQDKFDNLMRDVKELLETIKLTSGYRMALNFPHVDNVKKRAEDEQCGDLFQYK